MLADLHKLAGRKLVEARIRAEKAIAQWDAMVAFTRQLSHDAEADLEPQPHLIARITEIRRNVKAGDYFTALEIGEQAANASQELHRFFLQELNILSQQRAAAVSSIKADITQIRKRRDDAVCAAKYAKECAVSKAKNARKQTISNPMEKFIGFGCLGSVIGIVLLSLLFFIGAIEREPEPEKTVKVYTEKGETRIKVSTKRYVEIYYPEGWDWSHTYHGPKGEGDPRPITIVCEKNGIIMKYPPKAPADLPGMPEGKEPLRIKAVPPAGITDATYDMIVITRKTR